MSYVVARALGLIIASMNPELVVVLQKPLGLS